MQEAPKAAVGPRYPAPTSFNWTGLYAGAHIGNGWNTSNRNTYVSTTGVFYNSSVLKSDGLFGGIQLGYNHQFGNVVLGIEGDVSLANITGSVTSLSPSGDQIGAVSDGKDKILGSVRGRLGYTFNNLLIFGTGGIAYKFHEGSRTQYATASSSGAATAFSTNPVFVENSSTSYVGGTIGGGAEYALDKNWSITSSYRYTKWSNSHIASPLALSGIYNYVAPGIANGRETYSSSSSQTVQMGVNYKF